MNPPEGSCELCGFSLRYGSHAWKSSGREFHFCCLGCLQVFRILAEASGSADAEAFRNSDLFRQCRELGIIPATENDLKAQSAEAPPEIPEFPEPFPNDSPSEASLTLELHAKIDHMWCPACAWIIETALKKHEGLSHAACDFSTDRLFCRYDPVKATPHQIFKLVESLGYHAVAPGTDTEETHQKREFIRLMVSLFLTMNVMMLSFSLYSGFFTELDTDSVRYLSWPIVVLASAVFVYGGKPIFMKALGGIRAGAFGMEMLIATGAASAFGYSLYNVYGSNIHLYFDTSSMLISLVLLGKMIETRVRRRVSDTLDRFLSLFPKKVRLVTEKFPSGRYADIRQLEQGGRFLVETGDMVPADGTVVEGEGAVDESSLTGEAVPVVKRPGDALKSGSKMLNGSCLVIAEAVGPDCMLGRMIAIIEKALKRKFPMEQRTDKAMAWFVPGIVLAALITGIVTFVLHGSVNAAITRAVTVLVISCPCALGVAIPLGRVAGIVLAGQMGVLVRDFGAFQKAARIDTVVFDKTGTLTEGRWSLQRVVAFPPFAESLLLSLACALESGFDHPVAVGIREAAARKSVRPAEIVDRQVHENGVSAKWGNRKLRIGSRRFALGMMAADSRGAASPVGSGDSGNIESTVFMTVDGACAGEFRFGDMPRPESADTVQALGEMGYDIHLVSGDSRAATRSLARHVGIGYAHGELLPPQKADYIESLQSSGKTVAMIGDGINDAPAMVRSDLAVAMFGGKQLGKEAADVTLMSQNPGQVLTFLALSERVNRKIRQNLLFTFAYNLCAIPVAMAGLLSPLVAVCAMLLSSLSVIFNTVLLLKRPGRSNRDACRS